MEEKKIQEIYETITSFHQKHLKKHGVKLPKLKDKNDSYTKDALTLVYLANGYPNTRIVSKNELTNFIREFFPDTLDVQQARHLGAQKGWFILSGTRNDKSSIELGPGDYKLESLEKPYPGFTAERREEPVDGNYWECLKKQYEYRCACCGSQEGHPHRYWRNTTTKLQKGHMDPSKPLEPGNIIPQCEKCNRPDRNYWIYDTKGRVIGIANSKIVDNCSKEMQQEIYDRLKIILKV